jgi:hypothetical protein
MHRTTIVVVAFTLMCIQTRVAWADVRTITSVHDEVLVQKATGLLRTVVFELMDGEYVRGAIGSTGFRRDGS